MGQISPKLIGTIIRVPSNIDKGPEKQSVTSEPSVPTPTQTPWSEMSLCQNISSPIKVGKHTKKKNAEQTNIQIV